MPGKKPSLFSIAVAPARLSSVTLVAAVAGSATIANALVPGTASMLVGALVGLLFGLFAVRAG
ncbi:hypothetical protein RAM80_07930 [Pseudomonas sp. App30]|uniref:hypothetical protein n=1 Tax=Pseudomonas sp. App30 TaxID=3068990 RepID=UPI003A813784